MTALDDLGTPVSVPAVVSRVVSLVPSLTESVAVSAPGLVVGATDWCTHPSDLAVTRVGGTKNPDVAAVVALQPDLVLANDEENRAPDLAALRAAGLAVWVTGPRTVPESLVSLARMLDACGLERPGWLDTAAAVWEPANVTPVRRGFVPIWRRPWMALGRDTFASDLLRRLGVIPVHAEDAERYPRVDLADTRARGVDIVVCPDEPYAFAPEQDLAAFAGWDVPVAFVSGRHLTWYGPSLAEARAVLSAQLAAAVQAPRAATD